MLLKSPQRKFFPFSLQPHKHESKSEVLWEDASANLSTKKPYEKRKKIRFEPNICGETGELMCLCKLWDFHLQIKPKKVNRKCKAANTPLEFYDERALDFRW